VTAEPAAEAPGHHSAKIEAYLCARIASRGTFSDAPDRVFELDETNRDLASTGVTLSSAPTT
jgi:hypothetical protein